MAARRTINTKPRRKPEVICRTTCNKGLHDIAIIDKRLVLLAHPDIEADKQLVALKAIAEPDAISSLSLDRHFRCYKILKLWREYSAVNRNYQFHDTVPKAMVQYRLDRDKTLKRDSYLPSSDWYEVSKSLSELKYTTLPVDNGLFESTRKHVSSLSQEQRVKDRGAVLQKYVETEVVDKIKSLKEPLVSITVLDKSRYNRSDALYIESEYNFLNYTTGYCKPKLYLVLDINAWYIHVRKYLLPVIDNVFIIDASWINSKVAVVAGYRLDAIRHPTQYMKFPCEQFTLELLDSGYRLRSFSLPSLRGY
jgi:hypothetical protein